MERTLSGISPEELNTLIELYRVTPDEEAELRRLVAQDRKNGPPRTSMSAFTVLTDLELEAAEIRCWHSERIPGPLKSQRYALRQWGLALPKNKVTEVLRRQETRMRVLTMPDPPRYRAILSESSLYRMPGGRTPDMVTDQASHLLWLMAEYEQLELRILPFTADIPFVDNDFQLLLFDKTEFSDFAYIECPGGPRKCERKSELDKFHAHWTALDSAALDITDTRRFLTGLLEEKHSQPATH